MSKEELQQLLETEEVINNPKLKQELEKDFLSRPNNANELFLMAFESPKNSIIREQLLDLALARQVDFDDIGNFKTYISSAELEKCLNHGLDASKALRLMHSIYGITPELIDLLLAKGADIDVFKYGSLSNLNNAEYLLTKGLDPNIIIHTILREPKQPCDPASATLTQQQKHLLDIAIANGADLNQVFLENIPSKFSSGSVIPATILEFLLVNYLLNPQLVLEYAINTNAIDLANLAFTYHANPNSKPNADENASYLEISLSKSIEMADLLIEYGA